MTHVATNKAAARTPARRALAAWLALACATALTAGAARAQTVREDFYITNGQVTAEVLRGNTLYIGGSFSFVGPVTGAGVPVDATSGVPAPAFPRVSGTVMAALPDGSGGWYLGGLFTSVGGVARSNLAHVLADNSVAAWAPEPNGMVRAFVLRSGLLYVAGDFLNIGGVARNRIGAVDATSGVTTSWNPNSNSSVRALIAGTNVLYVAGQFTTIGGQARNRIAALNLTTGAADPAWNPNANSLVMTLWFDAGTNLVYAGGQFTAIDGQTRNRIAALDASSGFATSWNPNANNQVFTLVAGGGVVYAGGPFTTIGGQNRSRIAALDAGTGLATAWNPNASTTVQTLAISGATVYAGGDFLTIGGQNRSRVAALSVSSGLASAWNPSAFGTVSAVLPDGGQVFVGGTFNGVGGTLRNNLAALDVTSGQVTGWDPNANNQVQALLLTPGALYVGGNFSLIGGQIRNNAAALDLSNGLANAWDPNCDGQVSALALAGSRVYLGGLFNNVGGQPRVNLAAVDAATGVVDGAWVADTDDQVFALEAGASALYVGGNFTSLGGATRNFAGALDPVSGVPNAWDPNASGTVRTLVATCDRVYAGGFFTTIGGQARNRLAALNPATGQALAWDPNTNGLVFSLVFGDNNVYVGGVLSTVGGQTRNRVAAVDPLSGALKPWNPNSNGTVRTLVADAGNVYIGGAFTAMNNVSSGNLAVVTPDLSAPCPVISLAAPPLPPGVTATAYSVSLAASGGAGPYCYTVSAGTLPAGFTLDRSSGLLSGTPSAPGIAVFAVSALDSRGCRGTANYTLSVTAAPAVNSVFAVGSGLCLNPLQVCVAVPFLLTRGDATGLRAVSVTFQLESAKLRLCSPGPPAANAHLGTWANTFTNRSLQLTDLGGGRYTADVVILGQPCGATTGGTLFTLDLAAQGPLGTGSITVTSVTARDCANAAVAVNAGAPGSVNISNSNIALAPATLPNSAPGAGYSQTITASGGTPPYTFSVIAGALPTGLTLSAGGALSGTTTQSGSFSFTVQASETGGCAGSRAYNILVNCPVISVSPVFLPDGAVGAAYAATLSAPGGSAPFTYSVSAGTLPAGLTLSASGALTGTPTAAGPSSFTIAVSDAAGCPASRAYSVDIFASEPVSSVAAVPSGQAISSAHPCVSVPFVYTRGEAVAARGLTVSFQLDPTKLQLCSAPATAVHLGTWFTGFANTNLQVTQDGSGAYTVDVSLVGSPCGITSGGTLFTVDLAGVADGSSAITVTRVKSHDCAGNAIAVRAGDPATQRVQNTDITLAPATLPNAFVGAAYSQAITAQSGVAPFTFSVSAGTLPPGLTLSSAGLLAGTPSTVGSFGFTVSVTDAGQVPGSRGYTLTVACPVISIAPATLPDAQLGVAYSQTLIASGGTPGYSFAVTAGSLPAGLTLAPTGELTGTPTVAGGSAFTVAAVDNVDCVGSEVYTLAVFVDPAVSRVLPVTAGLCLSANRTCVSVPFVYVRGDSAAASAAHVTFHLDPRFALCTPGSPPSSIHPGDWQSAFTNKSFQVVDNGGGTYTVDQALLGLPCGPTHGGVLFTVDVASVGADGAGDITVTSSQVRDCANQPLPAQPGPPAQLIVSHTPPPAITDLVSAQVVTGNPAGSRTGITLSWSAPAPGAIALYRAPFGSYPEFDDGGGTLPDSVLAPGAPWVLVSAAATSPLLDVPPVRGSWHYVAFLTDSCGNRSAVSNRTRGALDYHLGDVSDGVTRGTGDNRVRTEDVSLLGAHYGISGATLVTANVAYLDVGPTIDGQPTSRPTTDDVIDFEDLMVFSLNYQVVSGPQAIVQPAPSAPVAAKLQNAFELEAPTLVTPGDEVVAVLHLAAAGTLQGFSAQLGWDKTVLQPLAVESAGYLEAQAGIVLSPRAGVADAALLGVRGGGIAGAGDVARFTFKVLREGDTQLHIEKIVGRDAANRPLDPNGFGRSVSAAVPARTMLLAPSPNPARDNATLAFALAQKGDAELAIYSVDGRRVRTLAHGAREAGAYRIVWQGDDDGGHAQAPGVYWARLKAGGQAFTRRLVFLR